MSKVELVKAATFELDPAKRYLVVFDNHAITKEDAAQVGRWMDDQGVKNIGVFTKIPEGVRVVEVQPS